MTAPWNSSGSFDGHQGAQPPPGGHGPYGPGGGGFAPRPTNPGAALGYAGIGAGIVIGPVGVVLGAMSHTRSRAAGASTVPGVVAMVVGTLWTLAATILAVSMALGTLTADDEPTPDPPPTSEDPTPEPTEPTDEPTEEPTEDPTQETPAAGENPGDTATPQEVRDVDLALGNCILDLDERLPSGAWQQVPCADPHNAEVVSELVMSEPDFPGTDTVQQQADDFCGESVPERIPTELDTTDLGVYFFYPTEGTWDTGDRLISCLVIGRDGTQLLGSIIAGDAQIAP